MQLKLRRRNRIGGGALFLTLLAIAGTSGPVASAAGPPVITEAWTTSVFSSNARLQAKINPNGFLTSYHFDYITKAAYDANVAGAKDPFAGASRVPAVSDATIGSGTSPVTVLQLLSALQSNTAYRYRVEAKNSATLPNYVAGPTLAFTTQAAGEAFKLPDSRGWEMVTPIDKNGGQAGGPGAIAGGGVLQASATGGQVTYSSEASFEGGGQGSPPASQYVATRGGGGWSAQNISAPLFSGTYDSDQGGSPYQLFSGDLARALLLNGEHCRGERFDCAVANPPLAGTDAPAGYQNYYLRDNNAGSFAAVLGGANAGFLSLDPSDFDLTLAGTSSDLLHGVVSTCAALTSNATEVPLGEGCDPAKQNLYQYSPGLPLVLVNLLPAQSTGSPGAALAAQAAAVSSDGSRVYWSDTATDHLYLRASGQSKLVGETATFETASTDGSFAFYTKAEHLYRYNAGSETSTDLTPGGEVEGVLGASSAGDQVYYLDVAGLKRWNNGTTTIVAADADAGNYPSSTGTSRVSADGTKLLFVSSASLTGYDNRDLNTGNPDSQVFLYDAAGPGSLTCVSCNPTQGRPEGASTIPGAVANGSLPGSLHVYKPRNLSVNGKRVFFDSEDAIGLTDTNKDGDVYQWEAQGEGSCNQAGGCISLISGGRSTDPARFVDASADGSGAFFLTDESLILADPGAVDLYAAPAGGGLPVPPPDIICEGDACQPLVSVPPPPTLTTTLSGPGNDPPRYPTERKQCRKGKVKIKGKCVRRRSAKRNQKRSGR